MMDGPKLKIKRAGWILDDLQRQFDEMSKGFVRLVLSDRPENPYHFELSDPLPEMLPTIIGDTVHNLRSALDVALCDIARHRGVGVSNIAFPFRQDKAAFDNLLADSNKDAPFKKLGKDIVEVIEAARPYHGGNDLLRGLHDLWNDDKHIIVRPVVSSVLFVINTPPELEAEAERRGKNSFFNDFNPYRNKGLKLGEPLLEQFYVDHPSDSIRVYGSAVSFPSESAFPGEWVMFTLRKLVAEVEGLIGKLEDAAFHH